MKTIRTISFLIGSVILLTLNACKKDQEDSPVIPGNYEVSFTPAAAPQYTGVIIPMSYRLSLHPGDVVTLSARVYDQNGTQLSGSANLTYSLTDNAQAVISGNQLTANQPGISSIEITDGTHTPASIVLEVVPASEPVSSNAYSIQFTELLMVMSTGSSNPITSYTITDPQGQVVSVVPIFFLENAGLGSVSGNTVTSSSVKGMTRIRALLNGDTLAGHLNLLVQNPGRATADTSWLINNVKGPVYFRYYQKMADPIEFTIVEAITPAGNAIVWPNMKVYTATPTSVSIEDSRILNQSNGQLVSVSPGVTEVKAFYKGGAYYSWLAQVNLDISGSWRFKNQNNDYINVCISQPLSPGAGIVYEQWPCYGGRKYYSNIPYRSGDALVQRTVGSVVTEYEGSANLAPAAFGEIGKGPLDYTNFFLEIQTIGGPGSTYSCQHFGNNPGEFIALYQSSRFTANRGSYSCTPTPNTGASLQDVLTQNTNRIWRQSASFMDYLDYSPTDLQFLANGTYIDRTPYDTLDIFVQSGSTTWLATADNQNLVLRYTQVINLGTSVNPGPYDYVQGIDTLRIATYSSSKFNIKGCNMIIDGQREEISLIPESPYLYWE